MMRNSLSQREKWKREGKMVKIVFGDHLPKQEGERFASTLFMFNICEKPPERSSDNSVVIHFDVGCGF
jgi:hypothetical protein